MVSPCSAMCSGSAVRTTVAFEAYGHELHRGIVESKGLKLLNVTVDDHGAVVDELTGADAALLTPARQSPIGIALGPRRRRQPVAGRRPGLPPHRGRL